MNYDLAKQLKDIGFPQGTTSSDTHYTHLGADGNPCVVFGKGAVYIPTLSELIEACGEDFDYLKLFRDAVVAKRWQSSAKSTLMIFYGSTPAEAVARLWLSLNEKKA